MLPPCRLDPTEVIADVQSVTAEQTSFAQSSVADAPDEPPSSPPQPAASASARTDEKRGDEGSDPHGGSLSGLPARGIVQTG